MLGAAHGSLVVGRVVIRSDTLSALALGRVVGFLGAQGGGRVGVFEVCWRCGVSLLEELGQLGSCRFDWCVGVTGGGGQGLGKCEVTVLRELLGLGGPRKGQVQLEPGEPALHQGLPDVVGQCWAGLRTAGNMSFREVRVLPSLWRWPWERV